LPRRAQARYRSMWSPGSQLSSVAWAPR